MKQSGFLMALIFFFSSCATHTGMISSGGMQFGKSQKYVDIAVGYSKTTYFLGLGGIKSDALISDAKRNMLLSNKLSPGMYFENTTMDIKTSYIGPYKKREVFVIADVVEGDSNLVDIKYSDGYLDFMSNKIVVYNHYFTLNENILFLDNNYIARKGKIIKLELHKATIFYIDEEGLFQFKKTTIDNLFKVSNAGKLEQEINFKIGQEAKSEIALKTSAGAYLNKSEGIIVGLNSEFALIKLSERFYYKVNLKNLRNK